MGNQPEDDKPRIDQTNPSDNTATQQRETSQNFSQESYGQGREVEKEARKFLNNISESDKSILGDFELTTEAGLKLPSEGKGQKQQKESENVKEALTLIKSGDTQKALDLAKKSGDPAAFVNQLNQALLMNPDLRDYKVTLQKEPAGDKGKFEPTLIKNGEPVDTGKHAPEKQTDKDKPQKEGEEPRQEKLTPEELQERLKDPKYRDKLLGAAAETAGSKGLRDFSRLTKDHVSNLNDGNQSDRETKPEGENVQTQQNAYQKAIANNLSDLAEKARQRLGDKANDPEALGRAIGEEANLNRDKNTELSQTHQAWQNAASDFATAIVNKSAHPGDRVEGNGGNGATGEKQTSPGQDVYAINSLKGKEPGDTQSHEKASKAVDRIIEKAKQGDKQAEAVLAALLGNKDQAMIGEGTSQVHLRMGNLSPEDRQALQKNAAEGLARTGETTNLSKESVTAMTGALKDSQNPDLEKTITEALGKQMERGNPAVIGALKESSNFTESQRRQIFDAAAPEAEKAAEKKEGKDPPGEKDGRDAAWNFADKLNKKLEGGKQISDLSKPEQKELAGAYKDIHKQAKELGIDSKDLVNAALRAQGSDARVYEKSNDQHKDHIAAVFTSGSDKPKDGQLRGAVAFDAGAKADSIKAVREPAEKKEDTAGDTGRGRTRTLKFGGDSEPLFASRGLSLDRPVPPGGPEKKGEGKEHRSTEPERPMFAATVLTPEMMRGDMPDKMKDSAANIAQQLKTNGALDASMVAAFQNAKAEGRLDQFQKAVNNGLKDSPFQVSTEGPEGRKENTVVLTDTTGKPVGPDFRLDAAPPPVPGAGDKLPPTAPHESKVFNNAPPKPGEDPPTLRAAESIKSLETVLNGLQWNDKPGLAGNGPGAAMPGAGRYFMAGSEQERKQVLETLQEQGASNPGAAVLHRQLSMVDATLRAHDAQQQMKNGDPNAAAHLNQALTDIAKLSLPDGKRLAEAPATVDLRQAQQKNAPQDEVAKAAATILTDFNKQGLGLDAVKEASADRSKNFEQAKVQLNSFLERSNSPEGRIANRDNAVAQLEQVNKESKGAHSEITNELKAVGAAANIHDLTDPKKAAEEIGKLQALEREGNPLAWQFLSKIGDEKAQRELVDKLNNGDANALKDLKERLPAKEVNQKMDELRTRQIVQDLGDRPSAETIRNAAAALKTEAEKFNNASAKDWLKVISPETGVGKLAAATTPEKAQEAMQEIVKAAKGGDREARAALSAILASSDQKTADSWQKIDQGQFRGDAKPNPVPDLSNLPAATQDALRLEAAKALSEIVGGKGDMSRSEAAALGLALAHASDKGQPTGELAKTVRETFKGVFEKQLPIDSKTKEPSLADVKEAAKQAETVLNGLFDALKERATTSSGTHGSKLLAMEYSKGAASEHNNFVFNYADKAYVHRVGDVGTSFKGHVDEITSMAKQGNKEAIEVLAGIAGGAGRHNSYVNDTKRDPTNEYKTIPGDQLALQAQKTLLEIAAPQYKDGAFRASVMDTLTSPVQTHLMPDRSHKLETLGKIAAQDPENIPAKVHEVLQSGLGSSKSHDSAARGMLAMAEHLNSDDVKALAKGMTADTVQQLKQDGSRLSSERGAELMNALAKEALDGKHLSSDQRLNTIKAMAELGPHHATAESIAALQTLGGSQGRELLKSKLEKSFDRLDKESEKKLNDTITQIQQTAGQALLSTAQNSTNEDRTTDAFNAFASRDWAGLTQNSAVRDQLLTLAKNNPDNVSIQDGVPKLFHTREFDRAAPGKAPASPEMAKLAASFKDQGAGHVPDRTLLESTKDAVNKHGLEKVQQVSDRIALFNSLPPDVRKALTGTTKPLEEGKNLTLDGKKIDAKLFNSLPQEVKLQISGSDKDLRPGTVLSGDRLADKSITAESFNRLTDQQRIALNGSKDKLPEAQSLSLDGRTIDAKAFNQLPENVRAGLLGDSKKLPEAETLKLKKGTILSADQWNSLPADVRKQLSEGANVFDTVPKGQRKDDSKAELTDKQFLSQGMQITLDGKTLDAKTFNSLDYKQRQTLNNGKSDYLSEGASVSGYANTTLSAAAFNSLSPEARQLLSGSKSEIPKDGVFDLKGRNLDATTLNQLPANLRGYLTGSTAEVPAGRVVTDLGGKSIDAKTFNSLSEADRKSISSSAKPLDAATVLGQLANGTIAQQGSLANVLFGQPPLEKAVANLKSQADQAAKQEKENLEALSKFVEAKLKTMGEHSKEGTYWFQKLAGEIGLTSTQMKFINEQGRQITDIASAQRALTAQAQVAALAQGRSDLLDVARSNQDFARLMREGKTEQADKLAVDTLQKHGTAVLNVAPNISAALTATGEGMHSSSLARLQASDQAQFKGLIFNDKIGKEGGLQKSLEMLSSIKPQKEGDRHFSQKSFSDAAIVRNEALQGIDNDPTLKKVQQLAQTVSENLQVLNTQIRAIKENGDKHGDFIKDMNQRAQIVKDAIEKGLSPGEIKQLYDTKASMEKMLKDGSIKDETSRRELGQRIKAIDQSLQMFDKNYKFPDTSKKATELQNQLKELEKSHWSGAWRDQWPKPGEPGHKPGMTTLDLFQLRIAEPREKAMAELQKINAGSQRQQVQEMLNFLTKPEAQNASTFNQWMKTDGLNYVVSAAVAAAATAAVVASFGTATPLALAAAGTAGYMIGREGTKEFQHSMGWTSKGSTYGDYRRGEKVQNPDGSWRQMELGKDVLAPHALEFAEGTAIGWAVGGAGGWLGDKFKGLSSGAKSMFVSENQAALSQLSKNLVQVEAAAVKNSSFSTFAKQAGADFMGQMKFMGAVGAIDMHAPGALKQMGMTVHESNKLYSFLRDAGTTAAFHGMHPMVKPHEHGAATGKGAPNLDINFKGGKPAVEQAYIKAGQEKGSKFEFHEKGFTETRADGFKINFNRMAPAEHQAKAGYTAPAKAGTATDLAPATGGAKGKETPGSVKKEGGTPEVTTKDKAPAAQQPEGTTSKPKEHEPKVKPTETPSTSKEHESRTFTPEKPAPGTEKPAQPGTTASEKRPPAREHEPLKNLIESTRNDFKTENVVMIAENGADPAAQRKVGAELLSELKQAGATHLVVDVPSAAQPQIDKFMKGEMTREGLQKALKSTEGMADKFTNDSFLDLLSSARQQNLKVLAAGPNAQFTPEQHAQRVLENVSALTEKDPNAKAVVWTDKAVAEKVEWAKNMPQTSELAKFVPAESKPRINETVTPQEAKAVERQLTPEQAKEIKAEINKHGQDPTALLANSIKRDRVLAIGESHTDPGKPNAQRDMLREAIPDLKKAGATHLAVEMPSSLNPTLEKFNKGQINIEQLKTEMAKELGDRGKSLLDPSYLKVLEAARDNGLKIVAVDHPQMHDPKVAGTQARENAIRDNVLTELGKDPGNKVVMLYGASHLANNPNPKSDSVVKAAQLIREKSTITTVAEQSVNTNNNGPLAELGKGLDRPVALSTAQGKIGDLPSDPVSKKLSQGSFSDPLHNWDHVIVHPPAKPAPEAGGTQRLDPAHGLQGPHNLTTPATHTPSKATPGLSSHETPTLDTSKKAPGEHETRTTGGEGDKKPSWKQQGEEGKGWISSTLEKWGFGSKSEKVPGEGSRDGKSGHADPTKLDGERTKLTEQRADMQKQLDQLRQQVRDNPSKTLDQKIGQLDSEIGKLNDNVVRNLEQRLEPANKKVEDLRSQEQKAFDEHDSKMEKLEEKRSKADSDTAREAIDKELKQEEARYRQERAPVSEKLAAAEREQRPLQDQLRTERANQLDAERAKILEQRIPLTTEKSREQAKLDKLETQLREQRSNNSDGSLNKEIAATEKDIAAAEKKIAELQKQASKFDEPMKENLEKRLGLAEEAVKQARDDQSKLEMEHREKLRDLEEKKDKAGESEKSGIDKQINQEKEKTEKEHATLLEKLRAAEGQKRVFEIAALSERGLVAPSMDQYMIRNVGDAGGRAQDNIPLVVKEVTSDGKTHYVAAEAMHNIIKELQANPTKPAKLELSNDPTSGTGGSHNPDTHRIKMNAKSYEIDVGGKKIDITNEVHRFYYNHEIGHNKQEVHFNQLPKETQAKAMETFQKELQTALSGKLSTDNAMFDILKGGPEAREKLLQGKQIDPDKFGSLYYLSFPEMHAEMNALHSLEKQLGGNVSYQTLLDISTARFQPERAQAMREFEGLYKNLKSINAFEPGSGQATNPKSADLQGPSGASPRMQYRDAEFRGQLLDTQRKELGEQRTEKMQELSKLKEEVKKDPQSASKLNEKIAALEQDIGKLNKNIVQNLEHGVDSNITKVDVLKTQKQTLETEHKDKMQELDKREKRANDKDKAEIVRDREAENRAYEQKRAELGQKMSAARSQRQSLKGELETERSHEAAPGAGKPAPHGATKPGTTPPPGDQTPGQADAPKPSRSKEIKITDTSTRKKTSGGTNDLNEVNG